MSFAVALEVVLSSKCFVAQRALKGPRPTVVGQMVFEVVGVEKPGRAVWTWVGALACMFPHVNLQFIVPVKDKSRVKTKT